MDVDLKPRPCIGCGFCCKKAPCGLAQMRGATGAPCQFLEKKGEIYRCGLYQRATTQIEKSAIATGLYFGAGCCCGLNSDRRDLQQRLGSNSSSASCDTSSATP